MGYLETYGPHDRRVKDIYPCAESSSENVAQKPHFAPSSQVLHEPCATGMEHPMTTDQPWFAFGRQMEEALAILRGRGVVAIPTDTQYGLAANALDERAVGKVFTLKGRPIGMAMPLLIRDPEEMTNWAVDVPRLAWLLADRFWPGALTMVLHKSPAVPSVVTGGRETVALRVPDHPVPRELARQLGAPITGTSANVTGQSPFVSAVELRTALGGLVDYVVDGPVLEGAASTVVDLTQGPLRILRPGAIALSELDEYIQGAAATRSEGQGSRSS